MFHQFFGENMLRADVQRGGRAGPALDHTGPVAAAERNAARIFNADHCFFVTNGTSPRRTRWCGTNVAPGDVVVVDRNRHVSILHAIIDDRRDPRVPAADAQPLRHHRPIPQEEFQPENIQPAASRPTCCARGEEQEAAHPHAHAEHVRRHRLQRREMLKGVLDGSIDTLHFDEAWLPHAAFHEFYATSTRSAATARAAQVNHAIIFATQRRTSCWPASRRRRRSSCRTRRRGSSTCRFNEAYLMHTSTSARSTRSSPVVRRVGGDDGAAWRHRAGRGIASRGARLPPRDAQGRRRVGQGLVVQGLGPERLAAEGIRRDDWILRATRSGTASATCLGFNMPRPDQGDDHHALPDVSGKFAKTGIPASIVTKYLAEHGVIVEKTGSLLVLHHVHHRHHQGRLEHAA